MKYKTETISIDLVKPNPANPRTIKKDKYALLVKSIKDFPQMLDIRPIVVDSKGVVLGGNMRLLAAKEAGLNKIPVIKAADLTKDQIKEFIIKDNVGFGEWDWDELRSAWSVSELEEWGVEVPGFSVPEEEQGDGFSLSSEEKEAQQQMTFTMSDADVELVKKALKAMRNSPGFREKFDKVAANQNGKALSEIVGQWLEKLWAQSAT